MTFDWAFYAQPIAALVVVLALIGLVVWLIRRFGWSGRGGAAGGRQRRLRIVEVMSLDAKHRLVLVRRDEIEHLILIGGAAPVVIEHGIRTPTTPSSPLPAAKIEPEPRL